MRIREAAIRNSENIIIAFMALVAISFVAAYLLDHGFMHEGAIKRWAMVLAVLGAEEVRLEHFSLLYPHFPIYVLIPFYYLPGLNYGAAPYFVSAVFASGLIALCLYHMRHMELSTIKRLLVVLLLVLHPTFLWGATNGSQIAMNMFMFYLLYHATQRLITEHDLHSYISLSVILAVMFFIDGTAVFLFVALLPMIAVVAPRRLLLTSPISIYFILSIPFVFSVLGWAWINWIFESEFVFFLSDPESTFLGGYMEMFKYPWLKQFGGHFFEALLVSLVYMILAYPIVIYFMLSTWDEGNRFRASLVLFLHPLLAIALATDQYFLKHPFEILVLINASILAELTFLDLEKKKVYWGVVGFLVISLAGGWWIFMQSANPSMTSWVQSFQVEHRADQDENGMRHLGRWLAENRQITMIDERHAPEVLVARGDAKGMILSFTDEFKIALNHGKPDVEQIVVPDPETPFGKKDKIGLRYPEMFEKGMPGYRMVYSYRKWRVYRKIDA